MATNRRVALSIAGSDPSGGAGIQADLKTFHQHGVYGCAVISLLTVQNTERVERVELTSAELVGAQLDAVLADIEVAAVKTGALGSLEIVEVVAERMAKRTLPLVIDPVRLATHGAALLEDRARTVLLEQLIPKAVLVTPNASEAAWLLGEPVATVRDAQRAAQALLAYGAKAVLIKGGHLEERDAVDVYADASQLVELRAPRLRDVSAHGLGCTLSAAITARIALGETTLEACRAAKEWLRQAIEQAPAIGHGRRPVDHFAPLSISSSPPTSSRRESLAKDRAR
jgi:hydroxymethylpyrimidine/phosphomethylpyrimidine kinase